MNGVTSRISNECIQNWKTYAVSTTLALALIILSTQNLSLNHFHGIGHMGSNITLGVGGLLTLATLAVCCLRAEQLKKAKNITDDGYYIMTYTQAIEISEVLLKGQFFRCCIGNEKKVWIYKKEELSRRIAEPADAQGLEHLNKNVIENFLRGAVQCYAVKEKDTLRMTLEGSKTSMLFNFNEDGKKFMEPGECIVYQVDDKTCTYEFRVDDSNSQSILLLFVLYHRVMNSQLNSIP